jgi:hypothetical protein
VRKLRREELIPIFARLARASAAFSTTGSIVDGVASYSSPWQNDHALLFPRQWSCFQPLLFFYVLVHQAAFAGFMGSTNALATGGYLLTIFSTRVIMPSCCLTR